MRVCLRVDGQKLGLILNGIDDRFDHHAMSEIADDDDIELTATTVEILGNFRAHRTIERTIVHVINLEQFSERRFFDIPALAYGWPLFVAIRRQ